MPKALSEAPSKPGSTIWIRRAMEDIHTKQLHLELTTSGQATHEAVHRPAPTTISREKLFNTLSTTEITFSRLGEITIPSNSLEQTQKVKQKVFCRDKRILVCPKRRNKKKLQRTKQSFSLKRR